MKSIKIYLILILIIALSACRNNVDATDDDLDNTEEIDINENSAKSNFSELDPTNPNDAQGTKFDKATFYVQLNMTPEQIQRFEKENPHFQDSMSNSPYFRSATMDKSLREILENNQYEQYETWRDNRTNNPNNSTNTNTDNYNSNTNTGNNSSNLPDQNP